MEAMEVLMWETRGGQCALGLNVCVCVAPAMPSRSWAEGSVWCRWCGKADCWCVLQICVLSCGVPGRTLACAVAVAILRRGVMSCWEEGGNRWQMNWPVPREGFLFLPWHTCEVSRVSSHTEARRVSEFR